MGPRPTHCPCLLCLLLAVILFHKTNPYTGIVVCRKNNAMFKSTSVLRWKASLAPWPRRQAQSWGVSGRPTRPSRITSAGWTLTFLCCRPGWTNAAAEPSMKICNPSGNKNIWTRQLCPLLRRKQREVWLWGSLILTSMTPDFPSTNVNISKAKLPNRQTKTFGSCVISMHIINHPHLTVLT